MEGRKKHIGRRETVEVKELSDKYVEMPHMDHTIMYVLEQDERVEGVPRWTLIQQELQYLKILLSGIYNHVDEEIDSDQVAQTIQDCVLTYSPTLKCTFGILRDTLKELAQSFYLPTLIFVIDSALAMPQLFPRQLPLLSGDEHTEIISLSKDKVCSILANEFFCTFPDSDRDKDEKKYIEYPRINFTELFDDHLNTAAHWHYMARSAKIEKVKCFFNYFHRMSEEFGRFPDSHPEVVFERRILSPSEIPEWADCKTKLSPLTVYSEGKIENAGSDCMQVNFTKMYIGGGTLGNGIAMEEFLFSCCPELVCAQLFTRVLYPMDCLLVHGYERYSNYTGYSSNFKFCGNHYERDGRRNHVVCMDPHRYPRGSLRMQLEETWMSRELNKCLVSFKKSNLLPQEDCSKIASGRWGCGVFNGDPLLKCLIQWIVAAYCGKELELYTFGDKSLQNDLEAVRDAIGECSLGQLYQTLLEYGRKYHTTDISLSIYLQRSLGKDQDEKNDRRVAVVLPQSSASPTNESTERARKRQHVESWVMRRGNSFSMSIVSMLVKGWKIPMWLGWIAFSGVTYLPRVGPNYFSDLITSKSRMLKAGTKNKETLTYYVTEGGTLQSVTGDTSIIF